MTPSRPELADALAHADWVRRLSRALVSEHDADDLAQDAWEAALRTDAEVERGWLRGVVRNLAALKHRTTTRRLRRELEPLEAEAPPTPDAVLERLETQRLLSTLVAELPEPTRTVLFLRYYEGLDATAIGERIGAPPGTVRWRLKQGIDTLREQLDARFGERQRWGALLLPLAQPETSPFSLVPGALLMKAKHLVVVALAVLCVGLGWWWWPSTTERGEAGDAQAKATAAESSRGARPGTPDVERAAGSIPLWMLQPGAPARRVAGRVLLDGAPVAKARVLLSLQAQSSEPQERWTADDGSFDFGLQRPAELAVSASRPGVAAHVELLDLRNPQGQPRPDALELRLSSTCDATLSGRVLDSGAGVVPSATVRPRFGAGSSVDAQGRYGLCLERGQSTLRIEAPGYGPMQASIWVSGKMQRDFLLSPEALIAGVVLDAASGAPVPDALVSAYPSRFQPDDTPRSVSSFSDASGRFRLAVAPGTFKLSARAEGGASSGVQVVGAAVGTTNDEVTLRVRRGLEVRGVVRSRGQAIAGAHVTAFSVASGQSVDAFSQADGRFVLEGVMAGTQVFTASPWKVERPRQWTATADGAEVELEVVHQASLHGLVTRKHQPVAGAHVSVTLLQQAFEATSDAAGRYAIEGLPRGPLQVVASSDAVGAFVLAEVTLKEAEDRELDLELESAATIEGVVVDERGAPLEGALVMYTIDSGEDQGRDTTDARGHFRCTQMTGGGAYTPEVFPSGKPGVNAKPAAGTRLEAVTLRDGSSHVEGIRLQVKVEKLQLAGRVLDPSGAPVVDAAVRVQSVAPGEQPDFRAYRSPSQVFTDAQGRFRFEDLSAGPWALRARSTQGDEAITQASAGATDVTITLHPAARIEGTLVEYGQPPVVYAHRPGAQPVAGQVRGNTFSLTVPAGTWVVSAMDNQEGDAQRVTVADGEVKKLTMTSHGTGKVRARVIDHESRLPIPDLVCHLVLAAGERPGITNWSLEAAPWTDDDGRFEQDPAPAGHVAITCFGGSDLMSSGSKLIDVPRGQTVDVELEFVRRRPGPRGKHGILFAPLVPGIEQLAPGGAGQKAGLQPGDLVVAVDGKPVTALDATGVELTLSNHPPGSTVPVTVLSQGQPRTVTLSL